MERRKEKKSLGGCTTTHPPDTLVIGQKIKVDDFMKYIVVYPCSDSCCFPYSSFSVELLENDEELQYYYDSYYDSKTDRIFLIDSELYFDNKKHCFIRKREL